MSSRNSASHSLRAAVGIGLLLGGDGIDVERAVERSVAP